MDNPWGAPEDFDGFSSVPPRIPSPPPRLSPPAASIGSSSFATPSWGDDGGGWGSAVDDYVPGAFGSAAASGVEVTEEDVEVEQPETYVSGSGGWGAESPELPRLSAGDETPTPTSAPTFSSSPPLAPPASPPTFPSDSAAAPSSPPRAQDKPEEEDDGRGWGGSALDDLPPIASLRLSSSSPPSSPPLDPASSSVPNWEPPELADALPSFGDTFARAKGRRESEDLREVVAAAERGEDAWGSSKGWEERMRREREEREEREQREREAAAAAKEAEDAAAADSTAVTSSRFRFFKDGVKQTAAKSAETLNRAHATGEAALRSAGLGGAPTMREGQGMTSIEGVAEPAPEKAPAPEPAPAKSSWWSRGGGQKAPEPAPAPAPAPPAEEDDPRSLGVEEVKQGESGRTASPEPQQQGAVGRFLSRFKRGGANADGEHHDQQREQEQEQHDSGAAARASIDDGADFNADDFDALANGGVGRGAQAKQDDADLDDALGGFFGDRRAQVPTAPPEDDFGGLLGALSSAPAKPAVKRSGALDPFDPLSDAFGAAPVSTSRPVALGRPLAPPPQSSTSRPSAPASLGRPPVGAVRSFPSLAPPQPPASSTSPLDDSFDDFFDSVAASTKPTPSPVVHSPKPRAQPSSLLASSASVRSTSSRQSSLVSPPPRIATMSPPVRAGTASPASSAGGGRASTPILPLAPPPPPSQPLASSRGGSGGLISLDAPPALGSAVQRTSTPLSAFAAPSPALSPVPARPSSQQQQQQQKPPPRSTSGPLSLDDLSFFES
ncbi:hypothetical protein JCM10207_000656 [Rhodosporidiobolus poonsookiae]